METSINYFVTRWTSAWCFKIKKSWSVKTWHFASWQLDEPVKYSNASTTSFVSLLTLTFKVQYNILTSCFALRLAQLSSSKLADQLLRFYIIKFLHNGNSFLKLQHYDTKPKPLATTPAIHSSQTNSINKTQIEAINNPFISFPKLIYFSHAIYPMQMLDKHQENYCHRKNERNCIKFLIRSELELFNNKGMNKFLSIMRNFFVFNRLFIQ